MSKQQTLIMIALGFFGALLFTILREVGLPLAFAKHDDIVTASAFNLVDSHGRTRAKLAFAAEGTPNLWLFDEKGVAREVLGLYSDGTSYFGLQDAQGRMIELLRSFGPKEAPLLIFKHGGQDMMITGLNPTNEPIPFLMSYDAGRARKVHFGKYDGP